MKINFLFSGLSILIFIVFFQINNLFANSYDNKKEDLRDIYQIKKVVIDAGHGGKDPGCHGKYSKEKDIALLVALKLGNYILKNFPNIKVIYTRKTDVFVELDERANIANKSKADLFISIHLNANKNKEAFGSETYVLGLHRNKENLEVAKRENSSILLEDNYHAKYDNFNPNAPESYITLTIQQSAYLNQSLTLAHKIQNQFKNRVSRKSRGVKQAGYVVLFKTTMPSVLVELGFLTNAQEENFLNSTTSQEYIASAIYRAFKEYKFETETKFKLPNLDIPQMVENQTNKKQKEPLIPKKNEKNIKI